MKKCIVLLMVVHLLLALSPLPAACQERLDATNEHTFRLPASLEKIDVEAFTGTIAKTVIFQDGFQRIESNAFFEANYLTHVYLPGSVEFIADSAFSKNEELTIHSLKGTYVQRWAEENNIDFVVDDIWTDIQITEGIHIESLFSLFWIVCPMDEKALTKFSERIKKFEKSMRPQDRPELYPIDYRFP